MSLDLSSPRFIDAGDGRELAVELSGAPHGWPVFLHHGMPGSRLGPRPRPSVLYRLGVLLISYDRPGYGGSTRREGRVVADAARDVEIIADALDIERFSVVGRSGGGPHALACAALLPERVARTGVLVSVAPPNAVGLRWYDGMVGSNVRDYNALVGQHIARLIEHLRLRADRVFTDPDSLLDVLRPEMTLPDIRVVNDAGLRRILADTYLEAIRCGPDGWLDDMVALQQDWGFPLDAVSGPMWLWHGEEDNFSPVSHTLWLASQIPHATIQVEVGAAHFGAIGKLLEMLPWLAASPRTDVGPKTQAGLERMRIDHLAEEFPRP